MEVAMNPRYTAIVRKSGTVYLAVCLELNLVAQGSDLLEVEKNLRNAIESYLEEISVFPETVVEPMPIQEFIEFLNDTEPESTVEDSGSFILKPLEVQEVARYA
jgi:predicted RNase H-like HicB family nuclease